MAGRCRCGDTARKSLVPVLTSLTATRRFFLLREPDLAHAALADFLEQVITANHNAGALAGVQRARARFGSGGRRVGVGRLAHVCKTPLGLRD